MALTNFDHYADNGIVRIKHTKTIERETGKKIKKGWPRAKIINEVLKFNIDYEIKIEKQDNGNYIFTETKKIKRIVEKHNLNKRDFEKNLFLSPNGNYVEQEPEQEFLLSDDNESLKEQYAYLETLLSRTQTLKASQAPSFNTPPSRPKKLSEIPEKFSIFLKWLARNVLLDTYWVGYPISWLITTIANRENPHYTSYPSKQLGKTLRDLIFPGGSKKPACTKKGEITVDAVFYDQIKAKKKYNPIYNQPFTNKQLVFQNVKDVLCTIRGEKYKLETVYAENNLVNDHNRLDATHIIYFNGNSGSFQQDYKLAAEDALRFENEHNLLLIDCGDDQAKFNRLKLTKNNNDLFVLFNDNYYYFNVSDKRYVKVKFPNLDLEREKKLIDIKNRCRAQPQFANELDIEFLREQAFSAASNEPLALPGKLVAITLFNYPGVLDSEGKVEITEDLFQAGIAQVEYLNKRRGVPYNKIVLKGGSMGGGVSATVAAYYAEKGIFLRLEYATNPIGSTPNTGQLYLNKALGDNVFSKIISTLCKPFIKLGTWGSEWTIDTGKAFYSLPENRRSYAVVRSPKYFRDNHGSVDDAVLGLGLLGTFEKKWHRLVTKLGLRGHEAQLQHTIENRKRKMMTVDVTRHFKDPTTGKFSYAYKECGHATATALYMDPRGRWYNPNKLDANNDSKKKMGVTSEGDAVSKAIDSKMIGAVHRDAKLTLEDNMMVRESGIRFRQTVFSAVTRPNELNYKEIPAMLHL